MINKRILLSGLALGVLSGWAETDITEKPVRKNVLFIAIDDMKPLLGCYGDSLAHTPVIDALAAKGTLFTAAYCQQAISAATRASLLTGMCPDRTRVWDLKTLIRDENPEVVTLPQYFGQQGYRVAGIGKIYDDRSVDSKYDAPSWTVPFIDQKQYLNPNCRRPVMTRYRDDVMQHYQSEEIHRLYHQYMTEARKKGLEGQQAENYVFRYIKMSTECVDLPDDAYLDGATANGAVRFIEQYHSDQPFFFAVGFKRPHLPFCAPKKYWDLYDRQRIPLAAFRERAAQSPDYAYHNCAELCSYTDIRPIAQYTLDHNLSLPEEKQRELIHGYYACVSYIDAQIGKVITALRKRHLDQNTIIVLWGDHGWHLGDHSLWNKHSNFEAATHVPMILMDPSASPRQVHVPVEYLDVYPTLCRLTHLPVPSHTEGEDLSPLIYGKQSHKSRPYAVSQYPRKGIMGYTLRTQRYRYTVWVKWTNKVSHLDQIQAEELYDYECDAQETMNQLHNPSYANALKQMREYWEEVKKKLVGYRK